jgi:HTH-type transcriptional regulator/antitoxin HipB
MPGQFQLVVTASQLGTMLRSARKGAGLTQAQLASRLGLSQARLSELELAPGSISVEQLLALCAQLGLQLQLAVRVGEVTASPPRADW